MTRCLPGLAMVQICASHENNKFGKKCNYRFNLCIWVVLEMASIEDLEDDGIGECEDLVDDGMIDHTTQDPSLDWGPLVRDIAERVVMQGQNVFITGAGGVGKTHFSKKMISHIKGNYGKNVLVTAPTGPAAFNFSELNGATIHSAASLESRDRQNFIGLQNYASKMIKKWAKNKVLYNTDVLFIDEISMVSAETFAELDVALRCTFNADVPFAGKPVICVGDFKQLPPVITACYGNTGLLETYDFTTHSNPTFAFECVLWKYLKFYVVALVKQIRQLNSPELALILSKIRKGISYHENLNAHLSDRKRYDDIIKDDDYIYIATRNEDVNKHNAMRLNALLKRNGGVQTEFRPTITGSITMAPTHVKSKVHCIHTSHRVYPSSSSQPMKTTSYCSEDIVKDAFDRERAFAQNNGKVVYERFKVDEHDEVQRFADGEPVILTCSMILRLKCNGDKSVSRKFLNGERGRICIETHTSDCCGTFQATFVQMKLGSYRLLMYSSDHCLRCDLLLKYDNIEPIESYFSVSYNLEYTVSNPSLKVKLKTTITAMPFICGFGFTVHKCQGLTFSEAVSIVLGYIPTTFSGAPVHNLYVALSRAKSMDQLVRETPFAPNDAKHCLIRVDPVVSRFYRRLTSINNLGEFHQRDSVLDVDTACDDSFCNENFDLHKKALQQYNRNVAYVMDQFDKHMTCTIRTMFFKGKEGELRFMGPYEYYKSSAHTDIAIGNGLSSIQMRCLESSDKYYDEFKTIMQFFTKNIPKDIDTNTLVKIFGDFLLGSPSNVVGSMVRYAESEFPGDLWKHMCTHKYNGDAKAMLRDVLEHTKHALDSEHHDARRKHPITIELEQYIAENSKGSKRRKLSSDSDK